MWNIGLNSVRKWVSICMSFDILLRPLSHIFLLSMSSLVVVSKSKNIMSNDMFYTRQLYTIGKMLNAIKLNGYLHDEYQVSIQY